jgi:ferric enterobactin receptor
MKASLLMGARRGWLVAILFLGTQAAHAQTPARVRGTVKSASDAAIEFATVTLHRAADSSVVKTEFSDVNGLFEFEQAAAGRYVVSAAQVGFVRQWSARSTWPGNQ